MPPPPPLHTHLPGARRRPWTSRPSPLRSDAWALLTRTHRWVQREARPISLRRLTFFGRTLTQSRLLDGANYCRLEMPTRYPLPP
jgi:pyruvate dehydrogenase kinase 2/3/4